MTGIVALFRPHQDSKLVLMGTEKASGLITVMSKGKAIPATKTHNYPTDNLANRHGNDNRRK